MRKPLNILVVLTLLLLFPVSVSASVDAGKGGTAVTLTADQVTSAIDIENAFHKTTAGGTRPGVVILDGSKGPFVLTGADQSVNFFYSHITLRGKNNAVITAYGFYIDGDPADDLVIENLTLLSKCDCIGSNTIRHRRVVIRNNQMQCQGMGIGVFNPADWTISNNVIAAQADSINFSNARRASVHGNTLSSGAIGVFLSGTSEVVVNNNTIANGWQGVLLNQESSKNRILQNSIVNVQQAGAALETGVLKNTITGNRVVCALDAACMTVNAPTTEWETNTIKNNRP